MSREGSVKKDASGRWFYVVDLRPAGGSRRQVKKRGFRTKTEAVDELRKFQTRVHNGLEVDPSTVTVRAYLEDHWLPSLPMTVRPSTLDTYQRLVRLHIVPHLGDVKLQKLERVQIAKWLAKLSSSDLSPKYVKNVHGVLSKALHDAIEYELLARNVATKPKGMPAIEPRPPRAWNAEELRRFLVSTAGDRLGPVWRLIGTTGLRRGEALGLRWQDVDVDASTITVVRQRTIASGRLVEGPPKTRAGHRTVSIDAGTMAVLRTWRATQAAERLMMGAGWPDHDLVFTNADGTGLWPQTVTAAFRDVSERLGLQLIGVHGLRHTAATWMISQGINPRVVQQRIGHSNVSVTLGLYTHVLPGHDRDAADAFALALDGAL